MSRTRAATGGLNRGPSRPAGGFTLIEVLVALTIVGLCLAAGMRAAGTMTNNAQRLSLNNMAQWCAENELTEMRLNAAFPGTGTTEFSCTQLGRTFTGKTEVATTANPNFRRVELRVFNDDGQALLSITTVVGRY
ncbi:type II secretion system minor pseudopilin GspI [Roseateles depolymerans]|uniref:Type II secretion system protein I n=1 Tax=Roseateles depolymerans TaxID=76731 RepID=A0A0U3CVT8_9BURK|nr:type II secretion system minor pseudopilin GspI [Roseateles depolymerans]ALV05446.1 general secretion pathway protein GspI [Roseateles depolymerans]REG14538.1 type II secretion system protein I (GspI) [Roseateles depolymerans]